VERAQLRASRGLSFSRDGLRRRRFLVCWLAEFPRAGQAVEPPARAVDDVAGPVRGTELRGRHA